jgi:hypothetical protein
MHESTAVRNLEQLRRQTSSRLRKVILAAWLLATVALCAFAQERQLNNGLDSNGGRPLAANLRLRAQDHSGADGTVKAIVIGFVGGFVRRDDTRHPEVQFAEYLQQRYSSVHAEVFSNHDGRTALRRVVSLLDTDHDGTLTTAEKERARIIIYGHSWGASETVTLARELGRYGIPVTLTIQVDTIPKLGQNGSTISPNVASAVNFYQPIGILHGRTQIIASDPTRTKIIGNFRMTYDDYPVNCDNYGWLARVFNRPHYEIENDPRVWSRAASLIDSYLSTIESTVEPSSSKPLLFSFRHP